MSGVVSLRRRIQIGVLLLILSGWSISSAREMLLFVPGESVYYYGFQLLTTGQLIFTGEILTTGSDYHYGFAVSPDQRYIWTSYSDTSSFGVKQYAITIYGQITATGRTVQLSGIPDDLRFTPNGQLIISEGGPIFEVNADSSIQTTVNSYSGFLNISPRGDINYTRGGYPESFEIDKISYTSTSLTTLEIITTGNADQPQILAVYRPAGDYIAFTNFNGVAAVSVYPVLPNGMPDTTQLKSYEPGMLSCRYLDITPYGDHIYAVFQDTDTSGVFRLDWSNQSSMYVDAGTIIPSTYTDYPQQIKVSPDGNFLVVVYQNDNNFSKQYLTTFSIQSDGSLVNTGYTFDFGDTFSPDFIAGGSRLIFIWTPLPTSVPEELWNEFDDK